MRIGTRLTALAAAMMIIGSLFVGPAWAGSGFEFAGTAQLSTSPDVDGVSCSSSTSCVIVGHDLARTYTSGSTSTPIAGLDGASQGNGGLNNWSSVSCAPDGGCMMFGTDSGLDSAFRPSAIASWTRLTVPTPSDLPAAPVGGSWEGNARVSCSSASFRLAIANFGSNGKNYDYVWRWDGSAWHLANLHVDPAGLPIFFGVDCWATRQCIVVGRRLVVSDPFWVPFTVVLDGNTWRVANIPHANRDTMAQAVSCWAAKQCIITGTKNTAIYDPSTAEVVVAWRWDGTTYAVLPGDTTQKYRLLTGLACTSATQCVVTGVSFPGTSTYDPTTEYTKTWDGTSWSTIVIHVTNLGGGAKSTASNAVSCWAPHACRLVGTDQLLDASLASSFLDTMRATVPTG